MYCYWGGKNALSRKGVQFYFSIEVRAPDLQIQLIVAKIRAQIHLDKLFNGQPPQARKKDKAVIVRAERRALSKVKRMNGVLHTHKRPMQINAFIALIDHHVLSERSQLLGFAHDNNVLAREFLVTVKRNG
jgi:hypothetical protein